MLWKKQTKLDTEVNMHVYFTGQMDRHSFINLQTFSHSVNFTSTDWTKISMISLTLVPELFGQDKDILVGMIER